MATRRHANIFVFDVFAMHPSIHHEFCQNVAIGLQAEARYRHLKILEQAMERHGASLLYFDPNSSDHQRAHVGKAMLDEQSLNTAALLDVNNSVQASLHALQTDISKALV